MHTSLANFRCPDSYRPFCFSSNLFICFLSAVLIACILTCYLQPLFVNNNSFSAPRSFYPCFFLAITFPILLLSHSLFRGLPLLLTQPFSSSMYFHFFPTYCSPHSCILHWSLPQCSSPQCLDAIRRSRGGAASAFSTIRTWDCEETEHTIHVESMCLLNTFKLRVHNNKHSGFLFCLWFCVCFKLVEYPITIQK